MLYEVITVDPGFPAGGISLRAGEEPPSLSRDIDLHFDPFRGIEKDFCLSKGSRDNPCGVKEGGLPPLEKQGDGIPRSGACEHGKGLV